MRQEKGQDISGACGQLVLNAAQQAAAIAAAATGKQAKTVPAAAPGEGAHQGAGGCGGNSCECEGEDGAHKTVAGPGLRDIEELGAR